MAKKFTGKVEVKLSRDYGRGITFTFGIDQYAEYDTPSDLSAIGRQMEALVLGQMQRFEVEQLQKLANGNSLPAQEESGEVLEGGTLIRNFTDGKVQYKWKVGSYTKYGLAVYEEVLAKAGIAWSSSEVSKDMAGWSVKLHVSPEGKVKIIKAWKE